MNEKESNRKEGKKNGKAWIEIKTPVSDLRMISPEVGVYTANGKQIHTDVWEIINLAEKYSLSVRLIGDRWDKLGFSQLEGTTIPIEKVEEILNIIAKIYFEIQQKQHLLLWQLKEELKLKNTVIDTMEA